MTKYNIYLFLILLIVIPGSAFNQDNPDNIIDDLLEDGPSEITSVFKSTRIINGHSIKQPAKGELEFRISHRFGKINGGIDELFGLDQATIHFSLEYSPAKRLTFGLGRSNYNKTVDGYVKFNLFRQQSGQKSFPLFITYLGSIEAVTLPNETPGYELKHRLSYVHQVLIARKISNSISLQLTPGLVHRNLVDISEMSNDIYSLGIGGRIKITHRLTLNAETFLADHGKTPADVTYYNPFSIGIDLDTGGHVFQIMVTNALPMREAGFITGTTGSWGKGDIHLGFNISRTFNVSNK